MPTENVTVPKLSDLIRDWAEQEGWPITVRPSHQYPQLHWVETRQLAEYSDDKGTYFSPIRGVYIGTVHNDEAYFAPYPKHAVVYFDAVDPEFFKLLAACIRQVFEDHPLLDKSALPNVK